MLAGTSFAASARAQTPAEQMLAQSLFDEGRALMEQKRYAEACPKLAESQRLDPGGGTLLNLAICHEQEGRLATAFMELNAAVAQARKDNRQDRIDTANAHLASIDGRIPRLTIKVAQEEPGLEVFLDGTLVRKPAWNVATIVDPGPHVVDARAPNQRAPFRMTIELAEGEHRAVEVVLSKRAARPDDSWTADDARTLPPPGDPRPERRNPVHTVAVVTGIGGFVLGGIGAIGWALSTVERGDECNEARRFCTPDGLAAADRERAFGWLTLIGVGVGTAGFAVAAMVPKHLSIHAAPTREGAAFSVTARF